jgi:hypothetical protein
MGEASVMLGALQLQTEQSEIAEKIGYDITDQQR